MPGRREPKDKDLFTPTEWGNHNTGRKIDTFWAPEFEDWIPEGECRIATLDELYTIKVSHSYWDLHGTWTKHISDAAALKAAGAKLDFGLHQMLYKVWEREHGAKKVDLDQEADEFFSDAVKRLYDHDSIHESVAFGDRPLYESFLADDRSVLMDMKQVWAAPFDVQVRLFMEEVFATALERIVIPRDYKCSPKAAYAWALKRTITSLTKGKSARFMVENYEAFRLPAIEYVKHHKNNAHKLRRLV